MAAACALAGAAQTAPPPATDSFYRGSAERINDLVHTKLNAHFDYAKSQMPANVWLTVKPHFYPTDSLQLDAKGMDIKASL